MSPKLPIQTADLQAIARLAIGATVGVTDIVEAMHDRIARWPGLSSPSRSAGGRTSGLTGFVYRTIRGVTSGVGVGLDGVLGALPGARQGAVDGTPRQPQREAWLAVLNGVIGDHLVATGNSLAIPMALQPPSWAEQPAAASNSASRTGSPRGAIVLIHGLCMNDLQWQRDGHDHGRMLSTALDLPALYLHYNSGRSIPSNGRALAELLERRFGEAASLVERLVLVGHSMGGLVARSALQHGTLAGHRWRRAVTDAIFIGTPHQGAPLERAGHGVDLLLGAAPYAAPLAKIGQLRSAGITDLRHGRVVDDEPRAVGSHAATAPGAPASNPGPLDKAKRPRFVPLPTDVRCFAIAATLSTAGGKGLKGRLLGDGLVTVASALGRHADAARQLDFSPEHQWVRPGIGHLDLLCDAEVAGQLQRWLGVDR